MICSRCGCFARAGEKQCGKCGEILLARSSVQLAESNSKRKSLDKANSKNLMDSSFTSNREVERVQKSTHLKEAAVASVLITEHTRYASFVERVYSGIFDATLLTVGETLLVCGLSFAFPGDRTLPMVAVHAGVPFVVSFLYYPLLESSDWQGTVGKKVFGLVVTDTNNKKLSVGRAFFKQALQAITGTVLFTSIFLLCSFLAERTSGDAIGLYAIGVFVANVLYFAFHCAIVFSKQKQSVFDKVTGRLVYKRHKSPTELIDL